MAQRCDCAAGYCHLNNHWDVVRLRTVETKFPVAYWKSVSIIGDARDCDRCIALGLIPMELSLAALASWTLHRCSCPCGVLYCLRGDCCFRSIAHNIAKS